MMLAPGTRAAAAAVLASSLALGVAGCTIGVQTASTGSPEIPRDTPNASAKTTAIMTIAGVDVDGQKVSVAGYIDGVVEDGGTCTYLATEKSTGRTVTITGNAVANVTTTSCGTSSEPIGSFSKGSWTVVLKYISKTSHLSSSPLALEIP